jgi:hypothetical protein
MSKDQSRGRGGLGSLARAGLSGGRRARSDAPYPSVPPVLGIKAERQSPQWSVAGKGAMLGTRGPRPSIIYLDWVIAHSQCPCISWIGGKAGNFNRSPHELHSPASMKMKLGGHFQARGVSMGCPSLRLSPHDFAVGREGRRAQGKSGGCRRS